MSAVRGGAPALEPSPLRWRALTVLALTQFMLLLDDMVVNIALPSIQNDFDVSTHTLAWVAEAYILAYGGFMMLGGRTADLFGRLRLFLGGLTLFGGGSLACGLAQSEAMLIAARALQGLGAAVVAPASLALVMTLFHDPRERTKALAVWGGLAGIGGTAGCVIGGALTEIGTWRWIFFINIPVVLVALAMVPRMVSESRARSAGGFDVLGAVTMTGSITLLAYALLNTPTRGWTSAATLGCLAVAVVLFAAFLVVESRLARPLVRLSFFRHRRRSVASAVLVMVSVGMYGGLFALVLYVQNVLDYTPLQSGLTYVPFGVALLVGISLTTRLLPRVGARPLMVAGGLLCATGYLLLSRAPLEGSYLVDLAPGMVVIAMGVAFAMIPCQVLGMADAHADELGLASGLLATSVQIGGALGLAVLAGLASDREHARLDAGAPADVAVVAGTEVAMLGTVVAMLVVALVAATFVGSYRPVAHPEPGELTGPLERAEPSESVV